jgi:hypothetical protein
LKTHVLRWSVRFPFPFLRVTSLLHHVTCIAQTEWRGVAWQFALSRNNAAFGPPTRPWRAFERAALLILQMLMLEIKMFSLEIPSPVMDTGHCRAISS